jgi:hypothetical protein
MPIVRHDCVLLIYHLKIVGFGNKVADVERIVLHFPLFWKSNPGTGFLQKTSYIDSFGHIVFG